MPPNPTITVRDLYPDLSGSELAEAEENIERYLTLVLRIFERMEFETNPQLDQLTSIIGTLPCTPPSADSSA
jgi:hypothetical protein